MIVLSKIIKTIQYDIRFTFKIPNFSSLNQRLDGRRAAVGMSFLHELATAGNEKVEHSIVELARSLEAFSNVQLVVVSAVALVLVRINPAPSLLTSVSRFNLGGLAPLPCTSRSPYRTSALRQSNIISL